jgi:hypothetical protein
MRTARALIASPLLLALLALTSNVRAEEVATPCPDEPLTCQQAPIAFSREAELPVAGGFDTGWIPADSPLQVHLVAQLYATTKIDLAGTFVSSWPEALTLEVPPEPGTGSLGIHYGLEVGAEAKVTVEVLGQTYSWTGDIPYVPQVDFQVEASNEFDPWAFDGVSVSGSTMPVELARISATDFIGIDIPGLDGGFELDAYVELEATYATDEIVVRDASSGEEVSGGPLRSDDATTLADYGGGPFSEFDVQPIGNVRYVGTIHLVPAFYIETLGPDFSIPVADIPIPFEFDQKNWTFDAVRVHVPLPDIELQRDPSDEPPPELAPVGLDFGDVAVGGSKTLYVTVSNAGEARLAIEPAIDAEGFVAPDPAELEPGGGAKFGVTFAPTEAGPVEGTLVLASNDPDEPVRKLLLRANASGLEGEGGASAVDDDATSDDPDDGCDCRATGRHSEGSSPWSAALFGIAIALAATRRRRR